MYVLDDKDLKDVDGGGYTAEWGVSVGTAAAFLGMGLAVANPIGAGILVGASIASSSMAMFYALH